MLDQLNKILPIMGIIVGWIVLGCVSAYSIPQLVKVIKTKNTSGLSIPGYIFFILSNIGMLLWGIGNTVRNVLEPTPEVTTLIMTMTLLPNVILNTLNMVVNVFCITLKIIHMKKAKKLGIDEDELAIILLKQKKQNLRKGK